MTTVTTPEITDEELRKRTEEIVAEERKPPADRWYNLPPYAEESDV